MDVEHSQKLLSTMLASAEGFRNLALGAGGVGEIVGGVLCWRSYSHVPLFNGGAITAGYQINANTLDVLARYFGVHAPQQRYSLLTMDTLTPGALRQLSHYGFREYERFPAMWLDLEGFHRAGRTAPAGLVIQRVEDVDLLARFREVLRDTFEMPQEEVELVMSDSVLAVPNSRHYIGLIEGRAVATATMVLDREIAGVWNVGTMPEWERRGIGGAVMEHILGEAALLGYKASVLLASPLGEPFYERLGYVTLDTLRVSVPDEDLVR